MQFLLPSSINLKNVTVFSSLHTDDFVLAKWKNLFLRHFNFFFEIFCISTFYAQIENVCDNGWMETHLSGWKQSETLFFSLARLSIRKAPLCSPQKQPV